MRDAKQAPVGDGRPRHRGRGCSAEVDEEARRAYARDEESCGFLVGPAGDGSAARRHRADDQPRERAPPARPRAVPAHGSHVLRHRLDEVRGGHPPRRGRRPAGQGALPLAPRRGRVLLADRRRGRQDGAGRAARGTSRTSSPACERARSTTASSSSGIPTRSAFVETPLHVEDAGSLVPPRGGRVRGRVTFFHRRARALVVALQLAAGTILAVARAELRESAERLAEAWRGVGASVVIDKTRFLVEESDDQRPIVVVAAGSARGRVHDGGRCSARAGSASTCASRAPAASAATSRR